MKVIARLMGGLGNQLFIYSMARRFALFNDAELVLDIVSGFERDFAFKRDYQLGGFKLQHRFATSEEMYEPYGFLRRGLTKKINIMLPLACKNYIEQRSVCFDRRLLDLRINRSVTLEGYWQSEGYFMDIVDILKSDLEFDFCPDKPNKILLERISNKNSVAVHMRFFKEMAFGEYIGSSLDNYYSKAIELCRSELVEPYFYVFSDRPDFAKKIMERYTNKFTVCDKNDTGEGAISDLRLMAECNHYVIANSTFSWWGAWLGNKEGKIVICPRKKLSVASPSWGFAGLIPTDWVQV